MAEPNLICTGTSVVRCTIDPDSGVISKVTPNGVPVFIEIGLRDGNVLEIYANGTHSDMDEFRFVEYQAPSNYPARKWLFEQFLHENYPFLWEAYRFVRWYWRKRGQLFRWYWNRTRSDSDRSFMGWPPPSDEMKRYPRLRLRRHRRHTFTVNGVGGEQAMDLEELNQQELERLKKWRDGKDFTLSTFNAGTNRCGRCRLEKPRIWALVKSPKPTFADIDFSVSAPAPFGENVCRDCLTSGEIAELLRPVFYFLTDTTVRELQSELATSSSQSKAAVIGSVNHVRTWLASKELPKPINTYREVGLRALEGLKGVPPLEIDWNHLYADLEGALSKDLYIAAHPDDIPQTSGEVDAWRTRISIFFRDGTSTERYALRDAVAQCVELFRHYFYKRVV